MSISDATTQNTLIGETIESNLYLDNSIGPAFVGLIISAFLFGATNVQTLTYFQKFPRDPKIVKCAIALLWVLDTVHLAFISHALYVYMVTDFTDIAAIIELNWTLCLQIIISRLIYIVVRLFQAQRLWIMSNRKSILPLGVDAVSQNCLFEFITADRVQSASKRLAFIGVKSCLYKSIFDLSKISWLVYMGLSEVLVADLWYVVPMCYFLWRDRTGFRTMDARINRLIAYFINTGLLTSVFSACCLITSVTMPRTYVYMVFYFCFSKLYVNALLAMFNSRDDQSENGTSNSKCNAYQLPRVINISTPHASEHETTFGTLADDVDTDRQIRRETSVRELDDKTYHLSV